MRVRHPSIEHVTAYMLPKSQQAGLCAHAPSRGQMSGPPGGVWGARCHLHMRRTSKEVLTTPPWRMSGGRGKGKNMQKVAPEAKRRPVSIE